MCEPRPTLIRASRQLPRRRPSRLVIAILLVPFTPIVAGGLYTYLNYSQPFDRQRWLAAPEDTSIRASMLNNLASHYLLPGTPRKRVLSLLGESDGDDQGPEATYTCTLDYGSEYLILHIRFDRSNRIVGTSTEDHYN